MSEIKAPNMKDFTDAPLCLSGRGVTKAFGIGEKRKLAVDHVDFDFHEGEFVSIVGESGSGKTTLSKMLLGLLNVTEGQILFRGKPRDISSGKKSGNTGRESRRFSRIHSPATTSSTKSTRCCWTALT